MPSFSDSIFLFVLALLLFGPKRLPVLARELGKWVAEFRRASNEFKMQMEEELRLAEQADRQKRIAAIEAAAPITPAIEEPEHPHLPGPVESEPLATEPAKDSMPLSEAEVSEEPETGRPIEEPGDNGDNGAAAALPIASSGELRIMPPSTGLPTPQRSASRRESDPLGGLIDSIPEAENDTEANEASTPETAAHDA